MSAYQDGLEVLGALSPEKKALAEEARAQRAKNVTAASIAMRASAEKERAEAEKAKAAASATRWKRVAAALAVGAVAAAALAYKMLAPAGRGTVAARG